jgi:hypothetical protein
MMTMMMMTYETIKEEEEEEEWEEWDRKHHVTAFTKQLSTPHLWGVPVYCSTPARRVSSPPDSAVVNVKTGKVFRVPSNYPTMLDRTASPVCFASPEAILGMKSLGGGGDNKLKAVVFMNANETDVENVFRFYAETTGDEPDPKVLRTLARSPALGPTHPWVVLGRTLEAASFLKAAMSSEDTFPERSAYVRARNEFTKKKNKTTTKIPYEVLLDSSIDLFKVKRPVMVADSVNEAYVIEPTALVPRRKYHSRSVKNMSISTYDSLKRLVDLRERPPKLVVFTTDDLEGVGAMIDFYESMPEIEEARCDPRWAQLARTYGAGLFEKCCTFE